MKIVVLCGGTSREKEVSKRSGNNILQALNRLGHETISLDPASEFISKLSDFSPELVFIALHGDQGEDGKIQGLLSFLGYRHTGSGVFGSSLCMNKVLCKRMLSSAGIRTPEWLHLGSSLNTETLERVYSMTFPVVAKPVSEGSSIGVEIIKKKDHFENRLTSLMTEMGDYFVEEYIPGSEITVSVIGSGKKARVLPILELLPKNEFYDYEAKYTKGLTEFIFPARIPERAYTTACRYAQKIFAEFGLRSFARVDMLVRDKNVYVIDVNTVPGMTDTSDLPASAKEAGIGFDEVVQFIVEDSLAESS